MANRQQQFRQPPRKRQRRRRRRGSPILSFLSIIFVIGAVGLAFSLFFKVTFIQVTGASKCDPKQIEEVSGIQTGDFLLFINEIAAVRDILSSDPYAESVDIVRHFPNTVEIKLTESVPMVCIKNNNSFWMVDKKGKLLEQTQEKPDVPEIVGLTLLVPLEGLTMALMDEQENQFKALPIILESFEANHLIQDVQRIDMTNAGHINFLYLNRFNVILGTASDVSLKLEFLPYVISRLEENAIGTLDLSEATNKISRFYPNDGTVPQEQEAVEHEATESSLDY